MPVPSILCNDPRAERGPTGIAMVFLAITLWIVLGALSAYGQTPILSPAMVGGAKPTPHRSGPSEANDAAEKIHSLLKAAQSELDRVVASPAAALDAPPGTPPSQLLRRQALLRQLIRTYEQQIDDMAALTNLVEQRGTLLDRLGQWRVDDRRPAYSMLAVEALRARLQASLRKIDMLKLGLAALDSQQEFAFETSKQIDESARQLLEKIEKRSGEVEKFIWERNLYLQQDQVAAAYIEAHKIRRKLHEEELSQSV